MPWCPPTIGPGPDCVRVRGRMCPDNRTGARLCARPGQDVRRIGSHDRNPAQSSLSVAVPPEVDGVVDSGGLRVLGEDEVGVVRCELDADNGLEVLARVEVPTDVETLA